MKSRIYLGFFLDNQSLRMRIYSRLHGHGVLLCQRLMLIRGFFFAQSDSNGVNLEVILTTESITWQTICCSVRGSSHIRGGLPNQDCVGTDENLSDGYIAVAVSDGHGSAKTFRSDRGSKFAVREALKVLKQVVQSLPRENGLSSKLIKLAIQEFPQVLIKNWRDSVWSDYASDPFTELELSTLSEKESESAAQKVMSNPHYAYGATLLAAVVTKEFVVVAQVGDGDILFIYDKEDVYCPIPQDERLLANETTSLCDAVASWNMTVKVIPFHSSLPRAILLATDGYSNSYRTKADFEFIGRDYLKMILHFGKQKVESELEGILSKVSANGSGDDISLALLYRSFSELNQSDVGGMYSKRFWTIAEAIQRTAPGSRVQVMPGTYKDKLVIDKDVEIVGIGHRDIVIIQSESSSCIEHSAGNLTLRNLTIQSITPSGVQSDSGFSIHTTAGTLTIDNCVIRSRSHHALVATGNSKVTCNNVIIESDFATALDLSSFGHCTLRKCKVVTKNTSTVAAYEGGTLYCYDCEFEHYPKEEAFIIRGVVNVSLYRCLVKSQSDRTILLEDGELSAEKCLFFAGKEACIIGLGGSIRIKDCIINAQGGAGIAKRPECSVELTGSEIFHSSGGFFLFGKNDAMEDSLSIVLTNNSK